MNGGFIRLSSFLVTYVVIVLCYAQVYKEIWVGIIGNETREIIYT